MMAASGMSRGCGGAFAVLIVVQTMLFCVANSEGLVGYPEALTGAYSPLTLNYYHKSCPQAEYLIYSFINKTVEADPSFAAAVLRLHFHDCFVHGCDGSVLIDSPPKATVENQAEMDAFANKGSLRGFEKVNELKALLEGQCPGVVSCADILAVSARDATVKVGANPWVVPLGRKDGLVSKASDAADQLPLSTDNYATLAQNFAHHNLSASDMVVLSGAHTIGRAHCFPFLPRLYNFTSVQQASNISGLTIVKKTDADLDPVFADALRKECPPNGYQNTIDMDPSKGGNTFDQNYFSQVNAHKGLFKSDAALTSNLSGAALVTKLASQDSPLGEEFGLSMIKMGLLSIPSGEPSEVHLDCSRFN